MKIRKNYLSVYTTDSGHDCSTILCFDFYNVSYIMHSHNFELECRNLKTFLMALTEDATLKIKKPKKSKNKTMIEFLVEV